jgi:SAM-dependent methyltransferase
MKFSNVYEDKKRAEEYSTLEFPGTYYLAYRDLPKIIRSHAKGNSAIDFGCGTGRSTRFLRSLGFHVIGIDISKEMVRLAKEKDPTGDYRLIINDDLSIFPKNSYDLVLSVFTFDNIPTKMKKVDLFGNLGNLLNTNGRMINLVSSPEIYTHEWASFSTNDFPKNHTAKSGDIVRIIQTDIDDKRPVEDILWTNASYLETFQNAGLTVEKTYKPLAKKQEPYPWINETQIAPWVIYILKKRKKRPK